MESTNNEAPAPAQALAELAADPQIGKELHAALANGVSLGGRTFRTPATLTFQRRTEVMRLIKTAGLMDVLDRFKKDPDPVALEIDVTLAAFEAGALFELYAALLVAEGEEWTPAGAQKTAAWFSKLTNPADHAALDGLVLWLVLDFFLQSANSSPIFLSYLHSLSTRTTVGGTSHLEKGGAESRTESEPRLERAATPISRNGTSALGQLPGLGIANP